MRIRNFRLMTKDLDSGGAPESSTEVPETSTSSEVSGADNTPEASSGENPKSDAKPNLVDRMKAATKSKPTLQANLTEAKKSLGEMTQRAEAAESALSEMGEKVKVLESQAAEMEQVVQNLEDAQTKVQGAAADQLSQLGVPDADLPGQQSAPEETLDSVRAKIKATSDPTEKAQLAKKARELRKNA